MPEQATAAGLKVREYMSKVDGKTTVLIPAAFEMSGRWGEGHISWFFLEKRVQLGKRLLTARIMPCSWLERNALVDDDAALVLW